MANRRKGSFDVRVLADRTRAFHLRFQIDGRRHTVVLHERPACRCGCSGGWSELAAKGELEDLLARVAAGLWRPRLLARARPHPPATAAKDVPSFGEYADAWLEDKIAGVLGDRPIAENTINDYRARLRHLAYLDPHPVDQIDPGLCVEFKAHLLAEAGRSARRSRQEWSCVSAADGRGARSGPPACVRSSMSCARSSRRR